jgi:formylglycine-generating enzyme required for sulfatase activity
MKAFSLIFLVFFFTLNGTAQTKKVAIQVDVLGKKHPTVRYYHPINGVYTISPRKVQIDKATFKDLEHFVLIDPSSTLHDSINHIQANSLRHYVDPSELIYVDWKMGHDTSNYLRLDTFAAASQKIRTEKYKATVQDYFNPFLISKYEVTNYEYRQFVNWVKDSIFREAIYESEWVTDEQALQMLQVDSKLVYSEVTMQWEDITFDRSINRELFPFNYDFDYRKEFRDDQIIPTLSQFYKRPNERFYKRPELDPRHFNYRYYSIDMKALQNTKRNKANKKGQNGALRGHEDRSRFIIDHNLNIYPDTTVWETFAFAGSKSAMGHMYFWHPAYDDMPVVGISHEQAIAFCDWKQKQLQKSNPNIAYNFTVDLPNLIEYEWAITRAYDLAYTSHIQDNNLVTDLYLATKNETEKPADYAAEKSIFQKVYRPYDIQDLKAHRTFLKLVKKSYSSEYSSLFGTTHEAIVRAQQNYLTSGVEFLSNNASEWMSEDYETHYKALFEAYVNYNSFANPEYFENQRNIDQNFDRQNDKKGHLIMGSNWYDERYGSLYGVNVKGLYAKRFKSKESSAATVGFRLVLRMNPRRTYN